MHRKARRKKYASKVGLPPGSLVHVGERHVDSVSIDVMAYDRERVRHEQVASVAECRRFLQPDAVAWINVIGLHEPKVLADVGAAFAIHPLVLEDILNTNQRPKAAVEPDYLFLVFKMLHVRELDGAPCELRVEQVSLLVGPGYVLTFQETPGDVFAAVRNRITGGAGRLRAAGSDYLAYALLDALVDNYFVVLEELTAHVEGLHDQALEPGAHDVLRSVQALRLQVIAVRKAVWPLREAIATLEHSESPLLDAATRPFFRDVYEHTVQAIETTESLRELLAGAQELYLSAIGNRTNAVMRVLTLIATVFMPLTFLVGVYGMNFRHMPELEWRYGYAGAWCVLLAVAGGMLWWFRRRHWL